MIKCDINLQKERPCIAITQPDTPLKVLRHSSLSCYCRTYFKPCFILIFL
jgi:hypothetical protein